MRINKQNKMAFTWFLNIKIKINLELDKADDYVKQSPEVFCFNVTPGIDLIKDEFSKDLLLREWISLSSLNFEKENGWGGLVLPTTYARKRSRSAGAAQILFHLEVQYCLQGWKNYFKEMEGHPMA